MSQKKGFLLFFLIIAMIWGERGLSAQAAKGPEIQNGRTDFKESAVSGSVKKYWMALSPYMDPVITLKDSAMEQVKIPNELKVLLYESNGTEEGDYAPAPIDENIPVVWSPESFRKGLALGQDFILEGYFVFTDYQKAVIENWEDVKAQLSIRVTTPANAKRLKLKWSQKRLIINYDKPWGAGQLWLEYSNDLVNWTSCNITESMTNDYYDVGTCMLYAPEDRTYYVRLKIIDFVYEGYTDIWKADYAAGICSRYQTSEGVNPPDTDGSGGNNTSDGSSSGSGTETETEPPETELGDGGSGGDRGGGGTKEPDRRPNTPSGGGSLSSGSGDKKKPDKGSGGSKGSSGSKGSGDSIESGGSKGNGDSIESGGSKGTGGSIGGNGSIGSDGSVDDSGSIGSNEPEGGSGSIGSSGPEGSNGLEVNSGSEVNGQNGQHNNGGEDDQKAEDENGGKPDQEISAASAAPSGPLSGSNQTGTDGLETDAITMDGREVDGIKEGNDDYIEADSKAGEAAGFAASEQMYKEGSQGKKITAAVFCFLAGSGAIFYFRRRK